jgi:hypothetical protein
VDRRGRRLRKERRTAVPFTHEQFLDVFGRYNEAWWPVALALWIVSAGSVLYLLRSGRSASRIISGLLAFHWLWSALAYHVAYFAAVNPGAWLFAVLFLYEAGYLLWAGVTRVRLRFTVASTPWHWLGYALVAYALVYPGLSLMAGLAWPRAPLFAVPCPTTLLTIGLLLTTESPMPIAVTAVPVEWACIGGMAATRLGVAPDFALPVAAAALLVRAVGQRLPARSRAF